MNTYSYIFINESFPHEFVPFGTMFLSAFWAVFGIILSFVGMITNADWKVLVGLCCVMSLFFSIFFFKIDITNKDTSPNPNSEDPSPQSESFLSSFKDLCSSKILPNFLIYAFLWAFACTVYTVQFVELESVGGSVYLNTMIFCSLEVISAFIAGFLTSLISFKRLLDFVVLLEGIMLLVFYFSPLSMTSASTLKTVFFLFCFIVSKICNSLIHLLIYMNLPLFLTQKYVSLYVISSRGLARILMIFVPSVNYLFRNLETHPFVLYGGGYVMFRVLLGFCQEFSEEVEYRNSYAKFSLVEKISMISLGVAVSERRIERRVGNSLMDLDAGGHCGGYFPLLSLQDLEWKKNAEKNKF